MIKHLLLLLVMMLTASASAVSAQSAADPSYIRDLAGPGTYYMEITSSTGAGPRQGATMITPGTVLERMIGVSRADLGKVCQDMRLSTPLDALNYLAIYGWKLESTFLTTESRGTTVQHWVVARHVEHPMQLLDGLIIKKK